MNSISNKFYKLSLMNTICNQSSTCLFERSTSRIIVPSRNTFILKRKYPVKLRKKEFEDSTPYYKRKDFVYELVENTETRKHELLPIILKQYIEGLGEEGDCVYLPKYKAYNKFILPGLADYATPEGIEKARIKQESKSVKSYSTLTAPLAAKYLESNLLSVVMNKDVEWTLEPWHIRVSFRKAGFHVPEECIQLPEKAIKGPNLDWELKCFCVTVTINKREKATVRCRLHHWSTDPSQRLPYVQNPWALPQEAIFPEDEEKIKALPTIKFKTINI